jgi:dihydrofolate synthase/folylpolyglutamate synthase
VVQTESARYADLLRKVEAELVGRWGEGRINPTRERIAALTELLGDPQRAYRSIHLTGTNGKTTTARMVDELLRGFGLRTGRFTSPHLSRITERVVLDGEPVSDRVFVEAYAELAPYLDLVDGQFDVRLSFFEAITALGFAIFADAPVDVAVVEVGLGGRWDATNVIDAEVAVITPSSRRARPRFWPRNRSTQPLPCWPGRQRSARAWPARGWSSACWTARSPSAAS